MIAEGLEKTEGINLPKIEEKLPSKTLVEILGHTG